MFSTINTGDDFLDKKIQEWLTWNMNKCSAKQVEDLLKVNNKDELTSLFLNRLEFGTAGLRGRMGPGYSQMNDLVIIQTAQGLLKYLKSVDPNLNTSGIVIGYDGRHNSEMFAKLSAAIFLRDGVPVYMFSKVCPTPFVPFTVVHFKCCAGVMVTASHNPKDDNGYKVYWSNGAQIISPHDKGIAKCILESLKPSENAWDISILKTDSKLTNPLVEIMESYFATIEKRVVDKKINAEAPFKITYTAMHGVGYPFIGHAFKECHFKEVIPVKEQIEPDPEFPTVKFPNPEEGKSALELSFKTADEHGCSIILANDPDADRLAVAEKFNGKWKVFTGNELGGLLGWWEIHTFKEQNPQTDLSNVYMLASTVSSKILKTISEKEGFIFEETLTGFKWMGNRTYELINAGKKVLFAFEEAIGFMVGSSVLDKDGISAAVRMAELAAFLYSQNSTLSEHLGYIYKTYGHHMTKNSYFICHQQPIIKDIFNRLRCFKGKQGTYPEGLKDGKYKVTSVRDLTTGYDSSKPNKKATLPVSKSSQMITFTFDNGLVSTLRTSGTEPKIKYYTELCASPNIQDFDELNTILEEMVESLIEEYLQPKENGLISRSD